jgi:putative ABC transport system permease protein
MAIPLSYNVRSLLRRPWSALGTAVGMGLVVAVLIGALALAAGFQAALVQTGSPNNALVLRTGADSEISSGVSRDAVNIIRALPDVARDPQDRPLISAELVVLTNLDRLNLSGSSNVPVRGINPEGFAFRSQVKVIAGRMFTPGTDEVIVGKRLPGRFRQTKIGDHLRFGQRDFTVVGHFAADGSAFETEIWGDATVLGPAFSREGVFQSVTFRMRDPAQAKALEDRLEKDPRLAVQVQTERQFYSNQSHLLAGVIQGAGIAITLIMAIGAIFGAMNTMYAAVGARTREIATLFVLGFSPMAVMMSFIFESLLLAFAGGLIGCLIALPINGITTSTTNWASFSEVAFAFRVTPIAMAIGILFALLMGLAGGFFPALRAARQPLALSLREM